MDILFEQNRPTGISVNDIFRTTGSKDKPLVIESIKYLEKGRLVKTDETLRYKQKRMKILTDLGRTFAELKHSVGKYNESYDKLKQAIKQNLNLPKDKDKKTLVNILRNRGWKIQEATKYKKFHEESRTLLLYLSPRQNIDVLLIRYVSLLSQHNVVNNENAKAMLNHIIMNLLSNQFTVIQKDLEDNSGIHSNEDNNKDESLFDHLVTEKFEVMDFIFAEGKSLEIRVIKGEAIEALLSILSILKPSKKALDNEYRAIGETVDIYFKKQNSYHQTA